MAATPNLPTTLKGWLTLVLAALGSLSTVTASAIGAVTWIDWRIVHVVEQRERDAALKRICDQPLSENPDKRAAELQTRAALGGCD